MNAAQRYQYLQFSKASTRHVNRNNHEQIQPGVGYPADGCLVRGGGGGAMAEFA